MYCNKPGDYLGYLEVHLKQMCLKFSKSRWLLLELLRIMERKPGVSAHS